MGDKYLNSTGLSTLWSRIKSKFSYKLEAGSNVSISTNETTQKVTVSATDTNTTYTFANGSNGSFTVTPSGGSAQTVSIGKPAAAGTADTANSVAWGNVSGKTNATSSAAGLMSKDDKTKLDGIAAGAEVNVQADWNQTTTTADDYIKNKPTIPGPYTLPAATSSTLGGIKTGYTTADKKYKVQLDSNNNAYVDVPWTDTNTDTHRPIQVNGTEILGNNITPLNLKAGSNVTLSNSSGTVTIAANDAMIIKGTIGSSGATVTTLPATHYRGWTYRVITAGTYAGKACEIGDIIICVTDGTTATDAHWTVVQTNIDGAVTGPASAVDNRIATFNGATGKIIKDSGYTIAKSVPSDAKFTDTTYESKAAASGGTAVSLVTTGEKYTWNNKTSNTGTVTKVSTGVGLTGGDITTSGTIKAKLKSETQSSLTAANKGTTSDREYAVGVDASGYLSVNVPWTDTTYNFSGTTFYSGSSGTAEHNANDAVKNGHYYYSSNGPSTSLGASTADGALYVQSYSDSWVGQIAQDYRNGALFVRGKNNGTWQNWQKVYDTAHKPSKSDVGLGDVANYDQSKAIKSISRSGTTFTYTALDDTTGTFTQQDTNTTYTLTQDPTDGHKITLTPSSGSATTITIPDNNTTYESKTAASGGTAVSLVTTGEKYTWNNKLSSHQTITQDGVTGATITRYGVCATGISTQAKTVSIMSGSFALATGSRVTVNFSSTNTASSPTLNVNSSGAKPIYFRGSQITTQSEYKSLLAGVCEFVYDGYRYHLVGNYHDTTYSLPAATSSALGGVKTGYTTSGKNYKVQLDSSNNAYVNVPWTDTTYSLATSTSDGLMAAGYVPLIDSIDNLLNDVVFTYTYGYSNFTYSSGFTYYANTQGSTNTPTAYKRAGVVTLNGAYKNTSAIAASTSLRQIGKVPAGCEPLSTVQQYQPGSNHDTWLMTIEPNGNIYMSRYGTTGNIQTPANAWLVISCTYLAGSV